MKKLAVIFPGMNYNSNKPLLYYIKKILIKEEFDIVEIEYGKLPSDKMKAFETAIVKANESIKDISYTCGFASPYYFSKVFSKVTGMSPSAYRSHTTG